MLDLHRIRYFLAVAEELSYSAAARRLYVDQATLSRAVQTLEKDLGVTLFGRTSRRVWLTPSGQDLLEEARRLVEVAESFRRRAAALAGGDDVAQPAPEDGAPGRPITPGRPTSADH